MRGVVVRRRLFLQRRVYRFVNPLSKTFAEAPVAAQTVAVGSDSMIVGKLSSVPEPVTLRASDILDDVELVKLESSDEATVGQGFVWVTDKRILIYSDGVVKQFDRSGKYLGKVGAKGNGPGEYTIAPYYMDVDEKAGRIYLMQYGAKDISVYNTSGEYIEHSARAGSQQGLLYHRQ